MRPPVFSIFAILLIAILGCDSGSISPFSSKSESSAGNGSGLGGSMARFAITGNYLYTVSNTELKVFDISQASNPTKIENVKLGFGIETIYPYRDKLFIGSRSGMKIYDNLSPQKPTLISEYVHIQSCDPVVVQDNYAYVTLRDGTACRRGINQLDVVDISNVQSPKVVFSLPMQNPHGLGIDGKDLFVCEGDYGLKVFDLANPVQPKLTQTLADVKSFDVIPFRKSLIVTGKDGLYQYDYSDKTKLNMLSKIAVEL